MEDEKKWKDASPWHPITNQLDLKVLGKLGEEACELGASIFRCIIQGIDEVEPETGKPNRVWLREEAADVYAGLGILVRHLGLDETAIRERKHRKMAHLAQWHAHAEEPPVAYQYEIACAMHQDERKGTPEGYTQWETRISAANGGPPEGPYVRNVRALL